MHMYNGIWQVAVLASVLETPVTECTFMYMQIYIYKLFKYFSTRSVRPPVAAQRAAPSKRQVLCKKKATIGVAIAIASD